VAKITPHTGGKCNKYAKKKKSSLIEGAQTKLRGMKETKESRRFEHTTKITNMMTMLKIK
jgi:hypothetical protein